MSRLLFLFFIVHLVACGHRLGDAIDLNNDALKPWLQRAEELEIQIRLTRIQRDKQGKVNLTRFQYREDDKEYFYPASTIKMPVAIVALHKLNEENAKSSIQKSINDAVFFTGNLAPNTDFVFDSLTGEVPTIKRMVEEIFSISDNNASNRLYEWLGPQYLNTTLYQKKAFTRSRIIHRVGVSGFKARDHNYFGEVIFSDSQGNIIEKVPVREDRFTAYPEQKNQLKGKGYMDENDALVQKPFDFSNKNFISLNDLEEVLLRVMLPEIYPEKERFQLSESDYAFLRNCMKDPPHTYSYLQRDSQYYDGYVKFFFDGDKNDTLPEYLQIYNKVGWAYGYLTDCSYVKDTKHGIEYVLTATIKVNEDGIFNDGKYEYETVGLPFFKALGRRVHENEINHRRNSN